VRRLVFVDFARALAVLFMVQGHVLDVLLASPWRQGALWDGWLFLRGLTSCTFLLLSGLAFSVTSLRRWHDHRRWSPQVGRRLRRVAFFVALAYASRFPAGSLFDLEWVTAGGWRNFFAVDILQTIGVTLLVLQGLLALAPTPRAFAAIAGALAAGVSAATPLVWSADWSGWPAWLAPYVSPAGATVFPLVPWSAYILLGAALGAMYDRWAAERPPEAIARVVTGAGLALVAGGTVLALMPWVHYGHPDFWRTNPSIFLVRSGAVFAVLGVVMFGSRRRAVAPAVVEALGAESLVIYVAHVALLYGSTWNPSLGRILGPQGPAATLGWVVVLLAASALVAWAWHTCKRRAPRVAAGARLATFAFLFGSLLI